MARMVVGEELVLLVQANVCFRPKADIRTVVFSRRWMADVANF